MKPQGTVKLLTGSMRIGLVLVLGFASGLAQTSPSQPNDVRKTLKQVAQTDPATPAGAKPPVTKPTAVAAKPAAVSPAQTKTAGPAAVKASAAKPVAPPSQVKTASSATASNAPGKPVVTQSVQSAAKPVPSASPNPSAPEVRTVAEHSVARRDPFDPLLNKDKGVAGPQAPLPAGKPGLVIASLRVDGIVRGPGGMIAVVSNPQMRVYFLREGDRLYDGAVEHITMEGVSFHETGKDAFGKAVERESTKRLYPTPGEQQ